MIHQEAFLQNYLESVKLQFAYYKQLGEKTFAQLTEAECLTPLAPETNSIAVIVNHLQGNMLSRWTDFLHSDGEKEWRNRDQEFESIIQSKVDLLEKWEAGWTCLFTAIASVNETNFDTLIYIRNMGHTITEAIQRQLAHYSYHIGQIVYIGNAIKGADWKSLSIPKGASVSYNAEKFAQSKTKVHFTKEFLENKNK